MKTDIKERWVAELRSGKYSQGSTYLERDGKFCCLGVLCTLAVEDGIINRRLGKSGVAYYDECALFLPASVSRWAGIEGWSAEVEVSTGHGKYVNDLTVINDNGTPFAEIADMIERSL